MSARDFSAMVEQARGIDMLRLVERHGGKLQKVGQAGHEYVGACPVCGTGQDRFSIKPNANLFNCRVCKRGGKGPIDLQMFLTGDDDFVAAVKQLAGADTGELDEVRVPPRGGLLAIWHEARDAHGTPVERYLAKRRLVLPSGAEVLRFHPACPFAGSKTPAMIALVCGIESNEPQAIHRTALDASGNKIALDGKDRMALGPISGGAIKLTSDENVTIALGIAEGIETALSLQQLPEWRGSPIWSLISAGGIRKFPLLSGIETLVIAADKDSAGENAALEAAERWHEREVLVIEAHDDGADLNDVIQRDAS